MRWPNKILNKKAAYDYIERERPSKKLRELSEDMESLGITEGRLSLRRVSMICHELKVKGPKTCGRPSV